MSKQQQSQSKYKYFEVGSLYKIKDEETGEDKLYIKLTDYYDIKINGESVNQYVELSKPEVKLQRLLSSGKITKEDYEKRLQNIPESVRYNVSFKTAKN